MNDEKELAALFDRLEACRRQPGAAPSEDDPEFQDLLLITEALDQLGQEPVEMPRAFEFQKSLMRRVRRRPPFGRALVGLAVAATLVAGVLFLREAPPPPSEIVIQPEVIDQVIEKQARTDMVSYLENTELLLVSIRDYDMMCSDDQLDMVMEKRLAQGLLLKQKMFHHSLEDPRYFQARELFDQLERILVDVNNLDPCSDKMELEFLNKHINKKRILSKLRVIAQEIQYS